MATEIKKINTKHLVEFAKGKFDNWCVYLTRENMVRYPPLDTEYFTILATLGKTHGAQILYNDLVILINNTSKNIDPNTLNLITNLAAKYGEDAEEVEIWFTVIYAGMIAEENKAFTRLGRRVKHLGLHQVLIDNMAPTEAANFSRGKNWRDLDAMMKSKNI